MSSKMLSILMRISVIAMAVCGLFLIGYLVPVLGASLATEYPEFSSWYLPWLIFLSVISIPCFAVLIFVWLVADAVQSEEVFTVRTASWIKVSAILIFADTVLFFVGNIIFWFIGLSHPTVLLASLILDIFAITLAVLAATLSRYLTKAALLQEESEGTI